MMDMVTVIGSLNMDLVVRTNRIPEGGETIPGTEFRLVPGGKGANQALASGRFGAETSMVGCVGQDAFGPVLLKSLSDSGVAIENVKLSPDTPTGTATIIVEENGENRIIVVAGANGLVSIDFIDSVWDEISNSSIILLQHEIPLETISMIVERAAAEEISLILNPAPIYPIPDTTISKLDVIILNETEGSALSGITIDDRETAIKAAEILRQKGIKNVIVTLGKKGAVLVNHEGNLFQPAFKIKAVDTTAAGDTFVGVFAASVLEGKSNKDALLYATAAAGLACAKLGAQTSIPTYDEVMDFINHSQ